MNTATQTTTQPKLQDLTAFVKVKTDGEIRKYYPACHTSEVFCAIAQSATL